MNPREAMEAEAALWLAREDRGLDAGERRAFETWMATTAHRVCYLAMKDACSRPAVNAALNASASAKRRFGGMTAFGCRLAAASLALAAFCLGGYHFFAPANAVYVTQIGQRQKVCLADGTRIELNTDTRLRDESSRMVRKVVLDRGEAYFDIAWDARRRFLVRVGDHDVTDIGTAFSIRRMRDEVAVLVASGKVRVSQPSSGAPLRYVDAAQGDEIAVRPGGAEIVHRSPREVADRLGWREGVLVLDRTTLAVAAGEFNRYNAKPIIVVGTARRLQLGGRFRTNNTVAFLTLLRDDLGLIVDDRGSEVVVSAR